MPSFLSQNELELLQTRGDDSLLTLASVTLSGRSGCAHFRHDDGTFAFASCCATAAYIQTGLVQLRMAASSA